MTAEELSDKKSKESSETGKQKLRLRKVYSYPQPQVQKLFQEELVQIEIFDEEGNELRTVLKNKIKVG